MFPVSDRKWCIFVSLLLCLSVMVSTGCISNPFRKVASGELAGRYYLNDQSQRELVRIGGYRDLSQVYLELKGDGSFLGAIPIELLSEVEVSGYSRVITIVAGQWEIHQDFPKIFTFHFQGSRLITLRLSHKDKEGKVVLQQSFIIEGWGPKYEITDVISQICSNSITNPIECPESVYVIFSRNK